MIKYRIKEENRDNGKTTYIPEYYGKDDMSWLVKFCYVMFFWEKINIGFQYYMVVKLV